MIHFLRKIRHSLIKGEGMKKYVLYAIGEIILVVVGILLALQIDDWNENRKARQSEQIYLLKIKGDLLNQQENIQAMIRLDSTIAVRLDGLLGDFSRDQRFLKDSIRGNLTFLIMTTFLNNINTTFDEMKSTGRLTLIQNDTFRSQLIELYQKISRFVDSNMNNNTNVFYKTLFPSVLESTVIEIQNQSYPQRLFDEAFKKISMSESELKLINAMNIRKVMLNGDLRTLRSLQTDISGLLVTLQQELGMESL